MITIKEVLKKFTKTADLYIAQDVDINNKRFTYFYAGGRPEKVYQKDFKQVFGENNRDIMYYQLYEGFSRNLNKLILNKAYKLYITATPHNKHLYKKFWVYYYKYDSKVLTASRISFRHSVKVGFDRFFLVLNDSKYCSVMRNVTDIDILELCNTCSLRQDCNAFITANKFIEKESFYLYFNYHGKRIYLV